jgi:hypothetical protein
MPMPRSPVARRSRLEGSGVAVPAAALAVPSTSKVSEPIAPKELEYPVL